MGETYGSSAGTDVPLLVETDDVALAGPVGTALYRRIEVPVTYDAATGIRITPLVDFLTSGTVTDVSYDAPSTRIIDYADGLTATPGTTCRARIEVTQRQGPVEIAAPTIGGQPLTNVASTPVGTAT